MSFPFDFYLVVPDSDRAQVLLGRNDLNWALCRFAFTKTTSHVAHVSRALLERMELSIMALRCLSY